MLLIPFIYTYDDEPALTYLHDTYTMRAKHIMHKLVHQLPTHLLSRFLKGQNHRLFEYNIKGYPCFNIFQDICLCTQNVGGLFSKK